MQREVKGWVAEENFGEIELIDLKRITRCKLASIFTSADHRKFLGLFGAIDL